MNSLMIAAHSVSPLYFASNWDTLSSQIGFSCGVIVAGAQPELGPFL